jgi:hypothetical protein
MAKAPTVDFPAPDGPKNKLTPPDGPVTAQEWRKSVLADLQPSARATRLKLVTASLNSWTVSQEVQRSPSMDPESRGMSVATK